MPTSNVVRAELARGLKQYLEESALHGYKYLLNKHGWIWRSLWVSECVLCKQSAIFAIYYLELKLLLLGDTL